MKKTTLPIYADEIRQDLVSRLTRVEGQMRGIVRMIEDDRPCLEVLQQLASTQAAMRSATKAVLRNYLEKCATEAIRNGDCCVYDDLMEAIYKFVK